MKIVVSGGSGFIGNVLVPRLLAEGHEIVLFTRDPAAARANLDLRVKVERWDGKTLGAWTPHIDGADAVLSFAGESIAGKRWTRIQKQRIIESRVDATNAIVEAIGKAFKRPAVLINASAVGFYGPVESGDVPEDYPRGNTFLSETTDRWEQSARSVERYGVRLVLLRISVVLGERGGALAKMLLPFRLFVGGPIGTGRQWFPWVHVDDLVNTVLFALSNQSVSGPVNVVAPQAVTMKEFCTALGKSLHRPSWVPVPAFFLKLLLGEMSDMVLTGQRAVPKALERHGFKFKFPHLSSALADILR
jgi:uncharacterized protein (TIGR01777 family)